MSWTKYFKLLFLTELLKRMLSDCRPAERTAIKNERRSGEFILMRPTQMLRYSLLRGEYKKYVR